MIDKLNYWKTLVCEMYFTLHALFLANVSWDFFLTVVVEGSHRSGIFVGLPEFTVGLIVVPWLVGIFYLAATSIVIINDKSMIVSTRRLRYSYTLLLIVYISLFVSSIFSSAVTWPLMLNYAMNVCWALSLMFFRYAIAEGVK